MQRRLNIRDAIAKEKQNFGREKMTPKPDPAHEKVFSVADIAFYHDPTTDEVSRVVF